MNQEPRQRNLSTRDLAAAADPSAAQNTAAEQPAMGRQSMNRRPEGEELAPLFSPDAANEFRARWDAVQSSFVDDPRQAVRQGDELVAQVMKTLAESFSNERARLEAQLDQQSDSSTENLRLALRRYRSFFERLLSV
jgi:hypothetical protein